jgi:hypothetical protein
MALEPGNVTVSEPKIFKEQKIMRGFIKDFAGIKTNENL